ncbi:class I adenylate-forming enzyme family protein [Cupriavidus sp. 2SB]|uniref:class I adenylate-forming enzyme family protein n=1 Tax=Cupriavidus sp. 2SB TaxID=2502199 RepID=UPI0010F5ACD4|nr:class I adenylate-forming enzyme family protein [Cupriavidus sp. 2SB]
MKPASPFLRLDDIPRHWACVAPDHPAIYQDGRVVTYAELWDCVVAARDFLHTKGVSTEDRVLIVAENSLALIALLFGSQLLTAWPVIANARLAQSEIAEIREHCQPSLTLFTHAASPDALRHGVSHRAVEVTPPGLPTFMVSTATVARDRYASERNPDVAMLAYTSGTTGKPKGVMLTHHGLLHFARMTQQARRMTAKDIVYGLTPMSHIFGIGTVLLATFHAGATLYLTARYQAEDLTAALAAGGISILQGMPTLFSRILSQQQRVGKAKLCAPRLRYLYTGGGPLEPCLKRAVEAMFGQTLHHGYGTTEYAGSAITTRIDHPRADTSAGHIIAGAEVRLVARDGSAPPPDKPGELWVRGPGVMRGYFRDPELTTATVTADGWLKTGDLARMGADNALHIMGRVEDVVVRAGVHIQPAEIEAVLNAHPAVRLSAVVEAIPQELVAFIEMHDGVPFDPVSLHHYVQESLPSYKRPSLFIRSMLLPVTASGKLLKRHLRDALRQS